MAQVVKRKAAPGTMGATKRKAAGKLSKSDAARRLASAIENHMSELNLSDEKKMSGYRGLLVASTTLSRVAAELERFCELRVIPCYTEFFT